MKEQRDVIISINDVKIQYKFSVQCTIADIISFIASNQQFKAAMDEAFQDRNKPLIKLPSADKIKLRHNSKDGSYCNTNLRLNQYNPSKRITFHVFWDQNLKQQYDFKPISKIYAEKKDIQSVHISLTNSDKSVSIDLTKEGKFQTVKDIVQFLRVSFGLNNQKTWFLFSTQRDQKVHADLEPKRKFKQWVKQNDYREINVMAVYDNGDIAE